MKLLLDEHFAPEIARQLREERGHDVQAVCGDPHLEALPDDELLASATRSGRVLVTENVVDFMPLHAQLLAAGNHHAGLLFTNPRRFLRANSALGRLVNALDEYLTHEGVDLRDNVHWL